MNVTIWIWLGATVLFGTVEAMTAGLVSIWFVAGSIAGLIAAALNASVLVQVILFAVVSAVMLAVLRPLAGKLTKRDAVATNADRVLGQTARVTEVVCNDESSGAVYVDGKTWTARSADGTVIPEGTQVRVLRMEGVKLYVERVEIKEEVIR